MIHGFMPKLNNIFSRQTNKYESFLSFALPILIGVAFISLPVSVLKAENRLLIAGIWLFAIVKLACFILMYIPILRKYWKTRRKNAYLIFANSWILYSIGLAISTALFPNFCNFVWDSGLMILWCFLGLAIAAILDTIILLFFILALIIKEK